MKTLTLAGLAAIVLCQIMFSSCTIEKRHYRPGYHIEWKKLPTVLPDRNEFIESENKPAFAIQEKKGEQIEHNGSSQSQSQISSSLTVLKKPSTTIVTSPSLSYLTPEINASKFEYSYIRINPDSLTQSSQDEKQLIQQKEKAQKQAVAAIVLGAIGVFLLIPAPIGLFFSLIALKKGRMGYLDKGDITISKVGLILSLIGTILLALVFVFIAAVILGI